MIGYIIHMLLLGGVIFALAEILPRARVASYTTALIVAVVYSLANMLLFWVLALLALPVMLLTLGLFSLVINAVLLWVTDQLIEDFEIDGMLHLGIMALAITVANVLIRALIG